MPIVVLPQRRVIQVTGRTAPLEIVYAAGGKPGGRGLPGAAGMDGGSSLTRTPTVALSGHRVVKAIGDADAGYPNLAVIADAELLLGVTTGASSAGASATIQAGGEMVEPSWTWTPGPVFCGAAGALTQTPPVGAAWLRQVGVAVAPDRLLIQLRPPILLT